jgi:hypothetical protein
VHDEIKFHTDRAMAELAIASKTRSPEAARAHLRLSALHLDEMRRLCGTGASPAHAA